MDFNFDTVLDIITQTMFGGNAELAGLIIMLGLFFAMLILFANVGAPPVYSLVPMMILDIAFIYLGYMNSIVGIVIMLVCLVVVARHSASIVTGGKE